MTQYLEAPVKVVDAGDVDMDPMGLSCELR